jgi:uncharacterized protein YlxP (DUF503 family)
MAMAVAVGTFELHFPMAHSLKEKRQVLRCVMDRVKAKFNVSIAEVEHHDLWQRGTVGVAIVGNDRTLLDQIGQRIEEILSGHEEAHLTECQWEYL